MDLPRDQQSLQPKPVTTGVVAVLNGVIAAENAAIAQCNKIIKLCDGMAHFTQDVVIEIPGSEEDHRREVVGFLKEYEKR